jgi:Putative transposase DNA-binding domain
MRKRLRPQYSQIVFKYRAYPTELPQQLWDTARLMQQTWSALITLREACYTETKDLDATAKKARWANFTIDSRELVSKSGLNWECESEILDRFQTASRRAAKTGATLRVQHRLDRINIPHRYTGGGMPVEKFFTQRSATRARLEAKPAAIYELPSNQRERQDLSAGIFGLDGGAVITFTCHQHRPIPAGAIVKKVLWCGNFDRNRKPEEQWQWYVQLVCEIPPVMHQRADTLVAGLDLGWRVMAEGSYLRIGMLTDSAGRTVELRLPLVGLSKMRLLRLKRPYELTSWADLIAIDEQLGNAVEACKAALRELLPALPPGFVQMRQSGLRKLLRELDTLGIEDDTVRERVRGALLTWDAYDLKLMHRKVNFQGRVLRRKGFLYQNLAAWLTTTYRTITWEGDLSLKQMAEQETGNYALDASMKYRQFAGLYELRSWIKQDAVKNGCELIDAPAAYSTRTCWECGELVENSGTLYLECVNHHRWDQDHNSSLNLLGYGLSQPPAALRKIASQKGGPTLTIPEVLKTVAILVQ